MAGPETPLLDATLERLRAHWAARAIPASLDHPDYDRGFGERLLTLIQKVCAERGYDYDRALDDFLAACTDFLKLQRQLERTGRYACPSFAHAKRAVYDDHRLMSTIYLNGLLFSQALWINHVRIFDFFRSAFARPSSLPGRGRVLEAPLGTGLFLAEFLRENPGWEAAGIDLTPASIEYAGRVLRLLGAGAVSLRAADVFDVTSPPFDRIICGELLEHVDNPEDLLEKLDELLAGSGRLFLTTAIWAASSDHVYLFESAADVREMLARRFVIEEERVLPIEADGSPEARRIPMSYACVLKKASMSR